MIACTSPPATSFSPSTKSARSALRRFSLAFGSSPAWHDYTDVLWSTFLGCLACRIQWENALASRELVFHKEMERTGMGFQMW